MGHLYRASKGMNPEDPKLRQLLCGTMKTILTTCMKPLLERDCVSAQEKEQIWAANEQDLKTFLVEEAVIADNYPCKYK